MKRMIKGQDAVGVETGRKNLKASMENRNASKGFSVEKASRAYASGFQVHCVSAALRLKKQGPISTSSWFVFVVLIFTSFNLSQAQQENEIKSLTIESNAIHLRSGNQREWARFPVKAQGNRWEKKFNVQKVGWASTLLIRQADVRRDWDVVVNGKKLGQLKKDQNDFIHHFSVPPDMLIEGENRLSIVGRDEKNSDDIRIGPVQLVNATPQVYFDQCRLTVRVKDLDQPESPLPCRITIVDERKSLVPLGARSNNEIAVREGVVYTVGQPVQLGLPAGKYQVFVNRGFEYSQANRSLDIKAGESKTLELGIRRVVDTSGWVSCDTHVHTLTHSGHGDCWIVERMITLAGEGIELPVATDHNKQIDYRPTMKTTGTEEYFTPLIGNEVTTDFGHFNAFPLPANGPIPNYREDDWSVLLPEIYKFNAKVAILNHARDIHRGYRPFDPAHFNEATGQSLNGRPLLFNAMEVINSAAQQTDQYQLFRDWLALTNGGRKIIPIGSSDSHDVNAFIVGQGRTYIRVDDSEPGRINVDQAIDSLLKGKVTISCGLMANLSVGPYQPGDLVDSETPLVVRCEMTGPHWLAGTKMQLFENGLLVGEKSFAPMKAEPGERFLRRATFELKRKKHDSFLVLLVSGPGFRHPSWTLSQPYQPTSDEWNPQIFGFTGATFIDSDGDGRFQSARDYASELVSKHSQDFPGLINALKDYDAAIATQAAGLFHLKHGDLLDETLAETWRAGPVSVKTGFRTFLDAWRKSERAKVGK